MPPAFWDTPQFRDAFAGQHMGRVSRAYRKHERHAAYYGRDGIPQELMGAWLGLTQAQVSRIENGPPMRSLDNLAHWARTLRVPSHLLWFKLLDEPLADPPAPHAAEEYALAQPDVTLSRQEDDVNRRELLRIMSMSSTLIAVAPVDPAGWEWPESVPREAGADPLWRHATRGSELWQVYSRSRSKRSTFPLVRDQLDVLTANLQRTRDQATHRSLCELVSELYQLAGEILFDCDNYSDAAQCYTLATLAGREAESYDLWAAALIRHSFVSLYSKQFDKAAAMLDLASRIAQRGDNSLSTRYWAHAVQAHALAGLADADGCNRALDTAEEVRNLTGRVHNGGWLRFHGGRLAEERGACYVRLNRPDLAESVLAEVVKDGVSPRRLASIHVDLAILGVQSRDPARVTVHATAAIEAMRDTGSGYVGRKLQGLQVQLIPLLGDGWARRLHEQIRAVTSLAAR
ncbi:transcriptional regulator [Sinosporangium siamense]|uniref:transcriptional regulator n=1 Tax=Sinosporangium siamense TaxID=1367973 RepID=UPI0035EBC696